MYEPWQEQHISVRRTSIVVVLVAEFLVGISHDAANFAVDRSTRVNAAHEKSRAVHIKNVIPIIRDNVERCLINREERANVGEVSIHHRRLVTFTIPERELKRLVAWLHQRHDFGRRNWFGRLRGARQLVHVMRLYGFHSTAMILARKNRGHQPVSRGVIHANVNLMRAQQHWPRVNLALWEIAEHFVVQEFFSPRYNYSEYISKWRL
jgi:hypothetical protein